jgi:hypothetical protein
MKIISLSSFIAGPACAVAVSIKNHFYNNINYKTNMFDYLEISLESINQILNTYTDHDSDSNSIYNKLHNNTHIYLNHDNNYSIVFKNFNKIISHHDLHINYTDNDYNEVINKYKRRFNRLIETIKNEDIVYFIRYGNDNYEEITNFLNNIQRINENLKVIYIQVDYNELSNPIVKIHNDKYHIYYLNFYSYIDNNITYNNDLFYKTLQFSWKEVYNIIFDNLEESYKRDFIYCN